jgi:hAT family C-terminal dimerisation region
VADTLSDPRFFSQLREILTIINPIVDEITKAEGDHSHIGLVIPRWTRIYKHLELMSSTSQHDWHVSGIWKAIQDRQLRQLTPLHQLAYWLTPSAVITDRIQHGGLQYILVTIERYVLPDHFTSARTSFLNFYNRQGPFHPNAVCWDYVDDEKLFWQLQHDEHVVLATLADRLWHTLANEVPSERAFSQMKITKSKTRNRLSDDRVNKLLFIQMNLRALHRQIKPRKKDQSQSDSDSEVDEEQHYDIEQIPCIIRPYEASQLDVEERQERHGTHSEARTGSQVDTTQPTQAKIGPYMLPASSD